MDKSEGEEQMKHFWKVMITMLLTALVLAGCGTGGTEQVSETAGASAAEAGTAGETAGTPVEKAEVQEEPVPDMTNFTYLEEYQIKDTLGDGKEYALYAPKGGKVMEEAFFTFNDHGISFSASVFPGGSMENLQGFLEDKVSMSAEIWQEDPECSDVNVGEMLEKGGDRYCILTAKDTDMGGVTFQRAELHYLSVRDNGVGVFLEMGISEVGQDEETALLIDDVARCYGLDLSEFAMEEGTWAEQTEQRWEQQHVDSQDSYEPRKGDIVLEKVEGCQYLGRMTMIFEEEAGITYPVFVPMGWNTSASELSALASIHGVTVKVREDHSHMSVQEAAREEADEDFEDCSDSEKGNRNVQISEIMPMQGQESGVFYVLEYEEKDFGSEEYHERADITIMIPVEEPYFVNYQISLMSGMYDSATNTLIQELETAYGLDLSKWYAEE